ncbi:hypothetical protein [Alkalihalobacillus sp. LMS39]|uniref:hypothetical protein n=1 Tax=Alkalihalobacillus sp. LMS39 TaxID=2924032 RepID=UPI001FB39385|nr:hypothetical protein [Alkalihalobacillus sp. LMS39]UOE92242.1 hypothetical protein MM271_13335 [Alkalihalobacillus sp. LMS39]
MNIPHYPEDFHECERGKRVTDEELKDKINEEISKMIEHMKKFDTTNHSVSFEDVLIIIDKIVEDDHSYFEISVSMQHSRGIVTS